MDDEFVAEPHLHGTAGHTSGALNLSSTSSPKTFGSPGSSHMMHGMASDDPGMSSMMGMMFFHGGCQEVILFSTWKTDDVGSFVGSWIAVLVMGFAFEWLKYYRDCMCAQDQRNKVTGKIVPRHTILMRHLISTSLYGVQTLLGYLLMLIFMIYNVYLCIAILLGATIGFFAIRYRKPDVIRQSVQHCDCME